VTRLYIATLIAADMETVWRVTQDPRLHVRWDARFHHITYLPSAESTRFRYATFGVAGVGVAAGEKVRSTGGRTSALRFASPNPLSPLRSGSGYWRYTPSSHGVRFATGFDYRPGWGWATDRVVRPMLRWLTAWSFDRLRIWLEHGVSPERSRNQAAAEMAARVAAVAVASRFGLAPALVACSAAVAIPPLRTTPAARRCRRGAGDADGRPPDIISRLEQP
jgi:hypothetical protein